MQKEKVDRINELARKAKIEPLTPSEVLEQQELRKEYITEYRNSLRSQLDNTFVVDQKGNKTKLKKN